MKKTNIQEIIADSHQRAEEILAKRKTEKAECLQEQEDVSTEIDQLKARRVLAAETANRALYEDLSKKIRDDEDKLEYAQIRAGAIDKAADPDTAGKEYKALQDGFREYEKKTLDKLLQLLGEYTALKNELVDLGGRVNVAAGRWKNVAGVSPNDVSAYSVNRYTGPIPQINPLQLKAIQEYLQK